MYFVASMVEPPPTASSTSMRSFLQSAAPARTESMRGFGSMPESSKRVSPAALTSAATASYKPDFLMEPPP